MHSSRDCRVSVSHLPHGESLSLCAAKRLTDRGARDAGKKTESIREVGMKLKGRNVTVGITGRTRRVTRPAIQEKGPCPGTRLSPLVRTLANLSEMKLAPTCSCLALSEVSRAARRALVVPRRWIRNRSRSPRQRPDDLLRVENWCDER